METSPLRKLSSIGFSFAVAPDAVGGEPGREVKIDAGNLAMGSVEDTEGAHFLK